ncbi:(E)-4-hydroxy-3-methylbut-2-enyl-diphosphate synthase [Treponema sp. OttesenSCG-928-L16]|nr:(E)-4-hydroxy-3-methylbut-2-enyl-diphosphate synthase [Treponema sp. OttesenSCG-928-L16]
MNKTGYAETVKIGGFGQVETVLLGSHQAVAIQTMWKDPLGPEDLRGSAGDRLISRIENLQRMGCSLLRFAVPDMESADVLGELASALSMPLTADIHFDYKIALRCLDYPIAKIRLNPGNIGSPERVEKVLSKAAEKNVPIRIGVNGGSLPGALREKVASGDISRPEALVRAAEEELRHFIDFDFPNVVVSMKASSLRDTLEANRIFASRHAIPLHIGVTEAGPLVAGTVRNSIVLHTLLSEGIGSTIRVSLSDTPENEIIAGREILSSLAELRGGAEAPGVKIISCPRCGRHSFDTHEFANKWLSSLYSMKKDVTIAIMGCAVNGPGEASHADLGITGAGDKVLLFRHGKVIRTISASEADEAFREELEGL